MNWKKQMLLTLLLTVTASLFSHEFWLEPQHFIFQRGEEINIRLRVGEGFRGENWNGTRVDVRQLKLHFAETTDNLIDQLSDVSGDSLQFKIFEEGTAMISFNNANRFITLDAKAFNAYLEEDGIREAVDFRTQNNETDSIGKEYYQRTVKTILQIGTKYTDQILQRTELILDIVPLTHPYRFTQTGSMPVQVFFNGQPLAGKMMRIWHRVGGKLTVSNQLTDAEGKLSFQIKPEGEWMVSCVAMKRLENDPKAQWQSYWGSLTWGYTRSKQKLQSARGRP